MAYGQPRKSTVTLLIVIAVIGWVLAAALLTLTFGEGGFLAGAGGRMSQCSLDYPVTCSGGDLSGRDLRGIDMSQARLDSADLSDAILCGNNMFFADLHGANLSGADLTDVDLSGALLLSADLTDADLTGAELTGAWGSSTITWDNTICPNGRNSDDIGPCFEDLTSP
jgi:uncharacterized protein YjbI with pentapeptide repeats